MSVNRPSNLYKFFFMTLLIIRLKLLRLNSSKVKYMLGVHCTLHTKIKNIRIIKELLISSRLYY